MKEKADNQIEISKRYKRWYNFLEIFFSIYARSKPDIYSVGGKLPEGGNLILANHVTKLDQFFIIRYYKGSYIRFVSGENVFKNPLFRFFVEKCLNVIVHLRGISAFDTVHEMTKSLRRGENVMIFPTGTMTFDGRSQMIDSSIVKLAKMSKCNLVLLRSDGGYFLQPRWGITTRKGKVRLTEHIVTAAELKNMSTTEITDIVNEHLYTDAYEVQSKERIRFTGKKLCKGLECCIYECPKCKKITGLRTDDNAINCECGFNAVYDEYGYLHDESENEYTISMLCDSQKENLKNRFLLARQKNLHEFIFGDDFELTKLYRDGKRSNEGVIRVDVYSDVIEYTLKGSTNKLLLEEVDSVFVYIRNTLNVNLVNGEYGYELQGDFSSNALKYRDLFQIYKG